MPGEVSGRSPAPWFLVSKPLRPPFRDGSTVLVRDLVTHLPAGRRVIHLGDPSRPLRPEAEVIPAPAMGYAPGMLAKARVLAALLRRRGSPLHLFFTPGGATSRVVRALRRLQPRRRMVQTVMSAHAVEAAAPWLRPLDAVVVLSEHTRRRLVAAGLPAAKIRRIHPAVATVAVDAAEAVAERRRLLYAGDLDAEVAARLVAVGRALRPGWSLTIACRPKAEGDAAARAHVAGALAAELAGGRVSLLGEVDDMDALLRGASLQLFVADHVRRKVDLPLVLIEGLARGVPVVSVAGTPVDEISALAAAHGRAVGAAVPASELVAAVTAATERVVGWSRDAAALAAREFSLPAMVGQYVALHEALESDADG